MPDYKEDNCECGVCRQVNGEFISDRMYVCPMCGNKRCPHVKYHGYKCSCSNDVGQVPEFINEDFRKELEHLTEMGLKAGGWFRKKVDENIINNFHIEHDEQVSIFNTHLFKLRCYSNDYNEDDIVNLFLNYINEQIKLPQADSTLIYYPKISENYDSKKTVQESLENMRINKTHILDEVYCYETQFTIHTKG